MLPASRRLERKQIEKVLKEGKSLSSSYLQVRYLLLFPAEKATLFSVVVSSKVANTAVSRNLIKRRLRDIVQKDLAKIRGGYGVVILAKKPANGASFATLSVDTDGALSKAGLMI